jgi:hypothetical protein
MVWHGMVFTHLGSIHARYTDVNRLSCQSCIVLDYFFWFVVIGLESCLWVRVSKVVAHLA